MNVDDAFGTFQELNYCPNRVPYIISFCAKTKGAGRVVKEIAVSIYKRE